VTEKDIYNVTKDIPNKGCSVQSKTLILMIIRMFLEH